jgi:hypothetical protein
MFTPGLADLLEPLSVVSAATHSVNILRNKRMVIARQGNPIHVDRPLVAGIGSQSEAHVAADRTGLRLHQADQIAHDDVGAGDRPDTGLVQCRQSRGFHVTVFVELCDLDGLHGCADRNFPDDHTSIRRPPKLVRKLC